LVLSSHVNHQSSIRKIDDDADSIDLYIQEAYDM
jgi:hypothetical protein